MKCGVQVPLQRAQLWKCLVSGRGIEQPIHERAQRFVEGIAHPLELEPDRRRDVHRQPRLIESREHLSEPGHRAASHRDRAVAARPSQAQDHLAATLFGDHDRIERAAAQMLSLAAALPDRVLDSSEQVGVLVDQPAGPEHPARFLVREQGQDQIPRGAVFGSAQRRVDHHRHAALHVERAATPHVAADDLRGERRMGPGLPDSRHHVDVALQQQRRSLALSLHARDQVGPAGSAFVAG